MRHKLNRRKLVINILTILISLVSVVAIYFGLQILLATKTPFVTVASGSMSPALQVGDLIITQGTPASNIQAGDIVVFSSPQGTRTIHRVTKTQTLPNGTIQVKTKGDANPTEEPYWTPEQNVHGRVLYRISYIGWLAVDPTIPIIIVVILVIIILVWPEKTKRFRPSHNLPGFLSELIGHITLLAKSLSKALNECALGCLEINLVAFLC